MNSSTSLPFAGALAAALSLSLAADAGVRREGEWPVTERLVTINVTQVPRSAAVAKVAQAAGWSIVSENLGDTPVTAHLTNVSPTDALDAILGDGEFVATRKAGLVRITAAPGASHPGVGAQNDPQGKPGLHFNVQATPGPSGGVQIQGHAGASPAPAGSADPNSVNVNLQASPAPSAGGAVQINVAKQGQAEDRTIFGGNLTIEKDQTANDVTVFGGSVEILGQVQGDVTIMGGRATVRPGAVIQGDLSVMGGVADLEDGSQVDGKVSVVGGKLNRSDKVKIGGGVNLGTAAQDDDDDDGTNGWGRWVHKESWAEEAGSSLTLHALLFGLGAACISLSRRKVEALQQYIASSPAKSGLIGLLGFMGFLVLLIALCITIIGIPVAIVVALIAPFAVFSALAITAALGGSLLLRNKTQNPYAHLALGCALLWAVGLIPVFGGLVSAVTTFVGIGALVATRGAGIFGSDDEPRAPMPSFSTPVAPPPPEGPPPAGFGG